MRPLIALAAIVSAPAAAQSPDKPIEVMVLGTYHFGNPGLDLNNIKADDVLKPSRQRELEELAKSLGTFKPTKIMVERVVDTPGLADGLYSGFQPADLLKHRDERYQVAYRLANQLGHTTVYGIDEQPKNGEPDYFPFGNVMKWAKGNGRGTDLEALMEKAKAISARMEERQKVQSVPQMLLDDNTPAAEAESQGFYYALLSYGDTEAQAGADLNAMWYLRNAKIFAKLMSVAVPGDRVLVVYGSGHNYWLRHFAATTPGYRNVDPVPYLARAAKIAR